MIFSASDLDIDNLKKNNVRLYYFGLGFIQLKLNEVERLHFYSSKLPAITEDVHNHRYGFLSRVLKGEITNNVYHPTVVASDAFDKTHTHLLVNETCNPEIKAEKIEWPCNLGYISKQTYITGQSYVMTPVMFHRVDAKDCITYLVRTHHTAEYAQVAISKGKTAVCPFSKKIPERELWELIEEMLNVRRDAFHQEKGDVKFGSLPAFYESSPGNFLWIDFSGMVVNGGWRPTFSEDRLSCWYAGHPSHVFRWVGAAPSHGDYNNVIDAFRLSREDKSGT